MWRIVEVAGDTEQDLTDSELIGLSILVRHSAREPYDDSNVYWRAWRKIQGAVRTALARDEEDDEEH